MREKDEIVKFYNTFLIKVSGTVGYLNMEKLSIDKLGNEYSLETAIEVVKVELEDLRTFVDKYKI